MSGLAEQNMVIYDRLLSTTFVKSLFPWSIVLKLNFNHPNIIRNVQYILLRGIKTNENCAIDNGRISASYDRISSTDTFGPSNMIRSTIQARTASNEAESRKRSKYASLTDRFDFQPIVVETSGVFGESTIVFLHNLGSRVGQGRRTGAYVADTAYLVGYCERQHHLICNVMWQFFFVPRVMIIFVSQCVIIIMFGLPILVSNL